MKPHRLAIWLLAPVILACVVVAMTVWHQHLIFYPTPETESAFLKSYTPQHVIDSFIENEGHSQGRGMSAGAGRDSVSHDGDFEFYVVLRRERWLPLMNALRDDVLQQLANSEAEVLSRGGNPHDGFRFDYRISKNSGSVMISPLSVTPPSLIGRKISLPEDMQDVTVRIEQTEKRFPKGAGTIQNSLTTSVH